MAKLHVLSGIDRVFGFTLDERGATSPCQYGHWAVVQTTELHHDEPYQDVDVDACLDDLCKKGFHATCAHNRITYLTIGEPRP